MSKKPRFRTPFDSQNVKGSQTLVKPAWEHFYDILSSLQAKLIWKTSPLVICEILRVFVKNWLWMTSILFGIVRICWSQFNPQHVKGSQTVLKSTWKHFYHHSLSLWVKLTWKMSLLPQFKCNYLKSETCFLKFLFHFWNIHQLLNILKKIWWP